MKTPKLKACPFCGKPVSVKIESVKGQEYYAIGCKNLACRGSAWAGDPNAKRAISRWNKRSGDRQPVTLDESKGIVPFASASGCTAKDLALQLWMQDVTSLLCYQPEVPHAHKESLVKALDHYNKRCAEQEEAQRHNNSKLTDGLETSVKRK